VLRAYRKAADTPRQRPCVSNVGMRHNASRSAPLRRITLVSLAVLGIASAAFVERRPLMMSAPSCMAGRWHGCFDTFNGVVLLTVVGLPPAALVVWALARRRQTAGETSAWRMSPAEVGMVYGTVPVRGAGVSAAHLGARGRLLGPGRDRAIRPAAGSGVLRGRRTAQCRRRRGRRPGVAHVVAHQAAVAVRRRVAVLRGRVPQQHAG
jgi:hypothetical protein